MSFPGILWYVGLEAYESRYTLQLTDWNVRAFKRLGVKYELVTSTVETSSNISVGQVLDATGRSLHALSQIQKLLNLIREGIVKHEDTIFFEDMFHPGIEALPYLLDQLPSNRRPKIFVRCLAQTIDPDDFVHVTGMARWMRNIEQSILKFVDGVFVASHEMLSHMTIAGWDCKAVVTGLPFDMNEVRSRVNYSSESSESEWLGNREPTVVFAARTDQEKQPEFFLELANTWDEVKYGPVEFVIAAGKQLSSNRLSIVEAIRSSSVTVRENLTKNEYYSLLTKSRVLFNCALQDWVSNTVSEADALGCNVLYPAYRSFPEVFESDHTRLYIPWSLEDAKTKLRSLLNAPHPNIGRICSHQSRTIARTLDAIANWDSLGFQNSQVVNPATDTSYRYTYNKKDWRC